MNRIQLEHIIRAASQIADDTEIVVIGSQAIHAQTARLPSVVFQSAEADVYPRNHPERADEIDAAIGELSPFHQTHGYYAHGVSPKTAILPIGWEDRLIPISNPNTGGAIGLCLDVHDLILSKYAAGREQDRDFNQALLGSGIVSRRKLGTLLRSMPVDSEMKAIIAGRIKADYATVAARDRRSGRRGMASIYERDLDRNAANYAPLSPISFLLRAARVWPARTAAIHPPRRFTYAQLLERSRRLASALARLGIGRGATVAVMAPNVPELLEAHYGVPMAGAVLCAINTRLDAATVAFILRHSEAKVLLSDRALNGVVGAALAQLDAKPTVIDIDDPAATAAGETGPLLGRMDYETFLEGGDPDFPVRLPEDEWDAIALGYTSGTTADPKGVVTHHRGAYLNATAMALEFLLNPGSVYLWTLPMFHCNGWTFTWAVTLAGGTHVCLRRVDPALIYPLIAEHGVTHMCAAPVVMTMLIHAPADVRRPFAQRVHVITGGAAPPAAVIGRMEAAGFEVHHLYGLTETYGPATVCEWQPGLSDLPLEDRAAFLARQGVTHRMLEEMAVLTPETMQPVPADGATLGELMLRGNTVMKGYLKNPSASQAAFSGGWFHTGDLAVLHPDGYAEVKDRSKDIIISGGENISSLEIEAVLYRHPDVLEAAVVAQPDERWGEVPHAFITLKEGAAARVGVADLIAWCRANMAGFKVPRYVTFGPLPKTSTGKIQKYALREAVRKPQSA